MNLYRLISTAPLCPAGHLPHKGGDHERHDLHLRFSKNHTSCGDVSVVCGAGAHLISPRVEEMSGRTEGGNLARQGSSSADSTTRKGHPQ